MAYVANMVIGRTKARRYRLSKLPQLLRSPIYNPLIAIIEQRLSNALPASNSAYGALNLLLFGNDITSSGARRLSFACGSSSDVTRGTASPSALTKSISRGRGAPVPALTAARSADVGPIMGLEQPQDRLPWNPMMACFKSPTDDCRTPASSMLANKANLQRIGILELVDHQVVHTPYQRLERHRDASGAADPP